MNSPARMLGIAICAVFLLAATTQTMLSKQRAVTMNPFMVSAVDSSGNPLHGARYTHKFGETGETTLGDAYDIWDCPSLSASIPDLYPWIDGSSPISLYAMSDDEADAGAIVVVEGLDADWERASEVVVLGADTTSGGTTATIVGTASNWTRVHRAYVVGSTELAGNLYLDPSPTDATGDGIPDTLTDLAACIVIGANQTLMAIYTTADDEEAYIVKRCVSGVDTSPGTPGAATAGAFVRLYGGTFRVQDIQGLHASGTSNVCIESTTPFYVPPRTDLKASIIASDSLNRVSASFDITSFTE